MTFTKILVPVDFSPHSDAAVATAIDLARRYHAALGLIHVYQPPSIVPPEGPPGMSDADLADLLGQIERRLEQTARGAKEAGVTSVDTALAHGVPFAEIVRHARAGGYDLVVMGTHGRTGIKHALLGSVAEKVVRKAPCAVLAVRLPGQAFEHP